jgi:hypothetical protein
MLQQYRQLSELYSQLSSSYTHRPLSHDVLPLIIIENRPKTAI